MAPKKKKKKQYSPGGPSSPSTMLVIMLVVFILISVILGALTYYGYQGQAELAKKAESAAAKEKTARQAQQWAEFQARELKAQLGHPLLKDPELDEYNFLSVARQDFQAGKFKDEKLNPKMAVAIKNAKDDLGWDGAKKEYLTSYHEKVNQLEKQLADALADNANLLKQKEAAEAAKNQMQQIYDPQIAQLKKAIDDGNQAALDKVKNKINKVDEYIKKNEKLTDKIDDMNLQFALERREKKKTIDELVTELEQLKYGPGGGKFQIKPNQPGAAEQHALLLDISKGRPLWDRPKGKILKVDTITGEVLVNLGRADGVEPELTFNVFGAGWDNNASGPLKGTIEIQKAVDEHTSVAQITSLFGANGEEIPLYDPYKGAGRRMAQNTLKEGDLLFNMFWKTHVAIAGKFNFSGYLTTGPADDLRELKFFRELLKKQDIVVDAFIDLTNGKVIGEMTLDTRYLILGDPADEKYALEGKVPDQALPQKINDQIETMRKEAIEKGMFLISAPNFAFVTGYRPPRSADSTAVSSFRTGLPTGGKGFDPQLGQTNGNGGLPTNPPKVKPMPGGGLPGP